MPTTRARHQVTETPDVSAALDQAAQHWPELTRAQLLIRLVELGRSALEHSAEQARASHAGAVLVSSGEYGDAFPDGYLEEMRAEWPD